MFNLFGKESSEEALKQKIEVWNLSELKAFMFEQMKEFTPTERGIIFILEKLTRQNKPDDNHPIGQRFLESNDHDSRKKKTFDLVLILARHSKINFEAIELIVKFTTMYEDLINDYDQRYREFIPLALKKQSILLCPLLKPKDV